jgi:hypothetical protein
MQLLSFHQPLLPAPTNPSVSSKTHRFSVDHLVDDFRLKYQKIEVINLLFVGNKSRHVACGVYSDIVLLKYKLIFLYIFYCFEVLILKIKNIILIYL